MRFRPGSACPQPEPNAAELRPYLSVSCIKTAAAAVVASGEARKAPAARAPKGKFLHHVLRHALRNTLRNALRRVLGVLVLHVLPKESVGGGGR